MARKAQRGVYRPVVQRNLNPLLARNVKGRITPRLVVIHTTESNDYAGLKDVDAVANYLARSTPYGIHVIVDAEGLSGAYLDATGQVPPVKFSHAGSVNDRAFGIELVAYARFKLDTWWLRPKQLTKAARWLAYFHAKYGIPLKYSTAHGVCRHSDVSGPGGHWDPGPGFPFNFLLVLARAYNKFGWTSAGPLVAKR